MKKRIIYFLPNIEAGVSRIVKNLVKNRPENLPIEYWVVLIQNSAINLTNRPVSGFQNIDKLILFSFEESENIFSVFKRMSNLFDDNDIIVDNDGLATRMVHALELQNRLVYIIHGDFDYYYSIIKNASSIIDHVITYSERTFRNVKKILPNKSCSKINYPVQIDNSFKSCKKINDDKLKLVFVGSLEKRKGADKLLKFYRSIENKMSTDNFQFEIVGDGPLLKELTKDFNKFKNVKLSGWCDNEYVLLKLLESDFLIFPSLNEGLPNVLIEAMMCGCIPVAFDNVSGVEDILIDCENGIIVTLGDVELMAEKVLNLHEDKNKLNFIRNQCYQSTDYFDPKKQSYLYESQILKTLELKSNRKFNKFRSYRMLDKQLYPNNLVRFIRRIIKNPKI
jgi:glycosyltransferase involved in cell wall biosynthesis